MTLLEQIQGDVKQAMLARDKVKVSTLRMLVNALQNEAKTQMSELDEAAEIQVLNRERKRRVEAADAYRAGGADDRADAEMLEADVIQGYLPEQLTDDDLNSMVTEAIAEAGATSPKDMGAVMKLLVPRVSGRADGKVVSQAVQAALRSASS